MGGFCGGGGVEIVYLQQLVCACLYISLLMFLRYKREPSEHDLNQIQDSLQIVEEHFLGGCMEEKDKRGSFSRPASASASNILRSRSPSPVQDGIPHSSLVFPSLALPPLRFLVPLGLMKVALVT